jgi:hypothetical protein
VLRLDERVVAVEHDVLDLRRRLVKGGVAAQLEPTLPMVAVMFVCEVVGLFGSEIVN